VWRMSQNTGIVAIPRVIRPQAAPLHIQPIRMETHG
jgi:hypothetical protein